MLTLEFGNSQVSQALTVPWIRVCTGGTSGTEKTTGIRLASAGLVPSLGNSIWESEDLGRGLFCCDDNQGGGVSSDHSGEDGGVNDEEVVRSVDLGVEIDHGGSAVTAIVSSNLGRTNPVVGPAV